MVLLLPLCLENHPSKLIRALTLEGRDSLFPTRFIEYLSFLLCLSKSKIMREREEQKQREEEAALSEVSTTQQDEVPVWQPPMDEVLQGYIDEVRNTIQPLATTSEQVEALAR